MNFWYKLLVRLTVSGTSARIGLVAFALVLVTVLVVVVDVKAPKRTPALELWLLAVSFALAGTASANSRAFKRVESRAKRTIARVAVAVIVWLTLVLGVYIVGADLKLALGGHARSPEAVGVR